MDADIIRMAREAGCEIRNGHAYNPYTGSLDQILKRLVALARADEREACAQVCDNYDMSDDVSMCDTAEGIAAAIRARNHQPPATVADRLARHGIPMPGDEK